MNGHQCEPATELATARALRLVAAVLDRDELAIAAVFSDILDCRTCLMKALMQGSAWSAGLVDDKAPELRFGIDMAIADLDDKIRQAASG